MADLPGLSLHPSPLPARTTFSFYAAPKAKTTSEPASHHPFAPNTPSKDTPGIGNGIGVPHHVGTTNPQDLKKPFVFV